LEGAYGTVCSALDKKTKEKVAIKKIVNTMELSVVLKRTYREIKILRHFKHDNIIGIRDILLDNSDKDFLLKDIYVVLDYMESDLHHIIHSKQTLSEEHLRYFMYQIFCALKFIHSADVIHRDLKPSNILVNGNCQLKIGDFGMARGLIPLSHSASDAANFLTMYVSTRWYRAPELMLSIIDYSSGVDVWAVGCIFAEMMLRRQLFPGSNYVHQMNLIVQLLGSPSEHLLKRCNSNQIRHFLRSLGKFTPIDLNVLFPMVSKEGLELLKNILVIDPEVRISVEKALQHPFLAKYLNGTSEPKCSKFDFSFENEDMTKDNLRTSLMDEIESFKREKSTRNRSTMQLKPAKKLEDLLKQKNINGDKNLSLATADLIISNDVHMTSSSCTSSKEMESFKSEVEPKGRNHLMEPLKKENDFKCSRFQTISSDTKALLKARLLSGTLSNRTRSYSGNEEMPNGKVTASKRHKEREEKRKKKKERALERKKKQLDKEGKSESLCSKLTEEDLSMLRRWSEMQTKATDITDNSSDFSFDSSSTYRDEMDSSNSPINNVSSKPNNSPLLDVSNQKKENISCQGASFSLESSDSVVSNLPSIFESFHHKSRSVSLSPQLNRDPLISNILPSISVTNEEDPVESLTRMLSRSAKLNEVETPSKNIHIVEGNKGIDAEIFPIVPTTSSDILSTPKVIDGWLDLQQELEEALKIKDFSDVPLSLLDHELSVINKNKQNHD